MHIKAFVIECHSATRMVSRVGRIVDILSSQIIGSEDVLLYRSVKTKGTLYRAMIGRRVWPPLSRIKRCNTMYPEQLGAISLSGLKSISYCWFFFSLLRRVHRDVSLLLYLNPDLS